MAILRLTKSTVEQIPLTSQGQKLYCDDKLSGFWLVVGTQSKTYVAKSQVNGKNIRYTIGKHGKFTTEEAREEARFLIADMARGIDPHQNKKDKRKQQVTLLEAFENFLSVKQNLSQGTKDNYKTAVNTHLKDWKNKPLDQITKEIVVQRNSYIQENNGGAVATKTMRIFSSIYNNALFLNDRLPDNPVSVLTRGKLWHKSKRRQSIIKRHDLKEWFNAVNGLTNSSIRDYLLLLLFTGMRKSEGLSLTWDSIDFKESTLTIKTTKNGRAHKLPLSDFTRNLLLKRYEGRQCNKFVFHGTGKTGHLVEPKKAIKKLVQETGIKFMLHDYFCRNDKSNHSDCTIY